MEPEEENYFSKQQIECLDVIATGGFGIIYLVYSHYFNQRYAMKVITREDFNPIELECMKLIDDPHVVRVYQHYKFNNNIYLLMEYCQTDLEKLILYGKMMSSNEMARMIYDTILCVKACHQFSVAHCDVKPGNFLIDPYNRVKITDFGMSIIQKGHPMCRTFRGTKNFMAPEILLKQEYNPILADIWALGCTIYFITTKHYPFSKDNLEEKIRECKYDESAIKDPLLKQVVASCLQIDPNQRLHADQLLELPYFAAHGIAANRHPAIRISRTRTNLKVLNSFTKQAIHRMTTKSFVHNSNLRISSFPQVKENII